jgi:hypothetical protein
MPGKLALSLLALALGATATAQDAQRDKLRALAAGKSGAFAHLQLARTAQEWGLADEMWTHLDQCLADGARSEAVERQVRAFLGTLGEAVVPEHARQADAETRVRALVRAARPALGAGRRAAIVEQLAAEPGVDSLLRSLAVREPLPEQRLVAVEALQRRGEAHVAFVAGRTARDRDQSVRNGTAALIRARGDGARAARAIAGNLLSEQPALRIQTAQALAELGDQDGAALLVAAGPFAGTPTAAAGGGSGTRAHMYKTTSRSFIRDFEVEIAQAAAVANPVVDVARDGVVLDVNVPAVVSHRLSIEAAYRAALARLLGADPGPDPATWGAWLRARAPEVASKLGK